MGGSREGGSTGVRAELPGLTGMAFDGLKLQTGRPLSYIIQCTWRGGGRKPGNEATKYNVTTNELSPLQGTISVISHLPHTIHVHAPNTEFCCTNYHKLHCHHNISLFRGKQLTRVENGHRQHCTKYTVHTPAEGSAFSIIDSATSVSPILSNSQIILSSSYIA